MSFHTSFNILHLTRGSFYLSYLYHVSFTVYLARCSFHPVPFTMYLSLCTLRHVPGAFHLIKGVGAVPPDQRKKEKHFPFALHSILCTLVNLYIVHLQIVHLKTCTLVNLYILHLYTAPFTLQICLSVPPGFLLSDKLLWPSLCTRSPYQLMHPLLT